MSPRDDAHPGRPGHAGHAAIAIACVLGLGCAALGGLAGVPVAAWCGVTLALAGRSIGPRLGSLALGLAAIYGLAGLASFAGTDPEDVAPWVDLRLGVIAFGATLVGITSALVWFAARRRSAFAIDEQ